MDARATIHAANPGKHRVERYSLEGKLLGHMGRFTDWTPKVFRAAAIRPTWRCRRSDWVYVTEKAGPRAKVWMRRANSWR